MADKKIGFVGLGVMGGPMAKHLLAANKSLCVFNRTRSKADEAIAAGAGFMKLGEMGRECDVIVMCVSRSEDVRDCLDSIGTPKQNCLIIDHSTIAPRAALDLHKVAAERGARFVDAPVTGGSMGAQKGQLTIFLGGDEDDCVEAKHVVSPYAKRTERVGAPGAGQLAKMSNQIAVAGSLLSLCESLAFAQKAGLDIGQIRELVGGGAGGSWNFENYGPKILRRDWSPGFTIQNQIKDLDYCHEAAGDVDAKIPATDLANQLLKKMLSEGHGEWTTAALFEHYLESDA